MGRHGWYSGRMRGGWARVATHKLLSGRLTTPPGHARQPGGCADLAEVAANHGAQLIISLLAQAVEARVLLQLLHKRLHAHSQPLALADELPRPLGSLLKRRLVLTRCLEPRQAGLQGKGSGGAGKQRAW